ncbi:MAG TPA: hypothetical protein VGE07_16890 [Herpetosiphonaceae bacterium]
MSDQKVPENPITGDDLTVRPKTSAQESIGASHPEGAADSPTSVEQTDFVAVGGPRSGGGDEGTQDDGIDPAEELPDAG